MARDWVSYEHTITNKIPQQRNMLQGLNSHFASLLHIRSPYICQKMHTGPSYVTAKRQFRTFSVSVLNTTKLRYPTAKAFTTQADLPLLGGEESKIYKKF